MEKLGIVCGLAFEAAILERAVQRSGSAPSPLIACSGPGADQARAAALSLTEQGADALMSFGVAGGLDPNLKTGTVIIASRVSGPENLPCDTAWAARLHETFSTGFEMRRGVIAATQEVLSVPSNKADLFLATGAAATDMESYGIAEAAAMKGVPFAAVRVICDAAHETIPPVATAAMTEDGRVRTITTLLSAAAHPSQIPDLIRLGRRTAQARAVLERLAGLGVPRLFLAFR